MEMETKPLLEDLEARLDYCFSDQTLLLRALTHRSLLHDSRAPGDGDEDYEGLEFLGDAILGFLVSARLFRLFPDGTEGELSKMRATLVSRSHLALTARQLGLGEFILMSRGEEGSGGRKKLALLADVFESVTAALYLDGGLEPSRRFVDSALAKSFVRLKKDGFKHTNYKSMLQEAMHQLSGATPLYHVISEEGPAHQRRFVVTVRSSAGVLAEGAGTTKKAAEQEAARRALEGVQESLSGRNKVGTEPGGQDH